MTKLLEEAIAALSQLPESEQDGIATLILEGITSEKQQPFDKSQSQDDAREKDPYVPAAKPFWQKIKEIGAKVPQEEWEKLPTDFARNFESYMYGVPAEE
jgi:type I restriction enzyme S subunit